MTKVFYVFFGEKINRNMKTVSTSFIIKFLFVFAFIFILGIFVFNSLIKQPTIRKTDNVVDSQLSPTPIIDEKRLECIKSGGEKSSLFLWIPLQHSFN